MINFLVGGVAIILIGFICALLNRYGDAVFSFIFFIFLIGCVVFLVSGFGELIRSFL